MRALKVEVLTGPQGGGKSTVMRQEAIASPGLYLFALPTRELIDEQVADFFRACPTLETVKVYSEPRKGPTARRLAEARADIEGRGVGHAVIFTTHATLMDHPLHGFDEWHVRIDEAPAAVQAGRFNIGVSLQSWLDDTFELVNRPGDKWSILRLKTARPNWKAVERDAGANALGEFIKQASQPDRVFAKTTSWDATDNIDWFSMWTPLSLAHMRSVQVAGTGYTDSIGFTTAKSLYEDVLSITMREIAPPRTGQPTINIHYYVRGHKGTTTFWEQHEGLRVIAPICDHLQRTLTGEGFWSGNKIIETVFYGRLSEPDFIAPMAMGLNKCREKVQCAFIFSATATEGDKPLMEVFDLTRADIERARESEAIAQFVMRGAIRNPDYNGPYDIYLYSEVQAERLREHLGSIGFEKVECASVDDAGVMEVKRVQARAPKTPEQIEEQAARRRDKDADRKKDKRADDAEAAGREPSANEGKGGRPTGAEVKRPRRPRESG